jgi:hypothetical protein
MPLLELVVCGKCMWNRDSNKSNIGFIKASLKKLSSNFGVHLSLSNFLLHFLSSTHAKVEHIRCFKLNKLSVFSLEITFSLAHCQSASRFKMNTNFPHKKCPKKKS